MWLVRLTRLILCICAFLSFTHAGHLHRHRQYKPSHTRRDFATIAEVGSVESQLASDIQEIEQDFGDLPTSLIAGVQSIANRLLPLESTLGIPSPTLVSSYSVEVSLSAPATPRVKNTPLYSPTTEVTVTNSSLIPSLTPSPPAPALSSTTSSTQGSLTDWANCNVPNNPYCRTSTPGSSLPLSSNPVVSTASRSQAVKTVTSTITLYRTITITVLPSKPSTLTLSLASTGSLTSPPRSFSSALLSAELSSIATSSVFPERSSVTTNLPQEPTAYPNFDPLATKNIAVYYGVTPATTPATLLTLCANPLISIINLAFLPIYFGPRSYPSTSFGPLCSSPDPTQESSAPGLQNCTLLGSHITTCQHLYNKVILVSLGGYIASSAFTSPDQAAQFAATLWNLFGAGNLEDPALRPFGPAIVDGFDVDNEDHSTLYYPDFATALREQYSMDASGRRYYISAAPQCPRPDASIPEVLMKTADFVWVQFYNNPSCDLDSGLGFLESYFAWSEDLAGNGTTAVGPRVFIGVGAWEGAGTGYVGGDVLAEIVAGARALGENNFGGIMMWDGAEGLANVDAYGNNYVELARAALE